MVTQPNRIGKYEILQEIGRGGFATVYQARDTALDRIVALKVLHPYWTADPDFATRFRREARAAANLRHPHVVTIHEAGQAEGQLYIAMEYLPGGTLRYLLEAEGPLPLERTLPVLEQIAEALDYAHGQGVVHRDVKPANVMVEETERGVQATLMDFGLVKAMTGSSVLTSQGTLLGSPEYMAPEQADPERVAEVGPAADRYALGIVAYQTLTGRVPFPGNTPATLNAHEHKPVPPPRSLRPELSEAVAAALLKMLAKSPTDRFASACAFAAQLRHAFLTESQMRMREAQIAPLYGQLLAAAAREDWARVLELSGRIQALDADYRDVAQWALHARDQLRPVPLTSSQARQREAQVASLYEQFQAAATEKDWAEILTLGEHIQALAPDHRNVTEWMTYAREQLRSLQPEPTSTSPLPLEVWGATDKGRALQRNEDAIYPHPRFDAFEPGPEELDRKGRLLAVADGLSGGPAGSTASRWATSVAAERYYDLPGSNLGADLKTAVEMANASLYQYFQSIGTHGAGSTLAAAVIHGDTLYVANVGDSRAYLIREGYITQLTRDHTLTQEKIDLGRIPPEEAELDPDRDVLTRSLGSEATVEVDLFVPMSLVQGDTVLLCSDGLTDMLSGDEIAHLASKSSPKRAVQRLIAAANRRGGLGNVSVVVARVGGGGLLADIPRMKPSQKIILGGMAGLAALILCLLAAWAAWGAIRSRETPTPAAPTAGAPVATTTAPVVPSATLQPTDTVPPGQATSTPPPTFTPTPTPRPDRDGDCIPDANDECPDDFGLYDLGGCPDSDGDGIRDLDDACAYAPGPPENDGCPPDDGGGGGGGDGGG